MSLAQRRGLALWAALLSAVVCLGFLPASRLISVLVLMVALGLIAIIGYVTRRRCEQDVALRLDNLPEATYRQPVVLVCGDLPQTWPERSQVLTVTQGCWIKVEEHQNLAQLTRQLLCQRPNWGRQLAVMVNVCPQQHADSEALTSRLLTLRWYISQLRREIGHSVPLLLNVQAGSAMMTDMLWQAAVADEGIRVWRESSVPSPISAWVATGGTVAMQQQVLMNSLMTWSQSHVKAVFIDKNPDIPAVAPAAMLWGIGPMVSASLTNSIWIAWLTRHTAIQQAAGWLPVGADSTTIPLFPDFILPLLPENWIMTLYVQTSCAAILRAYWPVSRGWKYWLSVTAHLSPMKQR